MDKYATEIVPKAEVDALLIELSDKPIDHAEEEGQLIVHFSKEGEPVMLEVLDAREFLIGALRTVLQAKEAAVS